MEDDRRVIVIGSGPAGATAARVLSDSGIAVMLLEAGTEHAGLGLTVRLGGLTVAKLHRAPPAPRTDGVLATGDEEAALFEEIAPGGLSNHWSCAVPRFSESDFRDAERAGDAHRWPIGYPELAPWYDFVEPLLHISGTDRDAPQLPAGRVRHVWELGPDWKKVERVASGSGRSVLPIPYAYGSDTTMALTNNVFNSFHRLVKPVLRAGRVKVRFQAHVLRLERSASTGRVVAVAFRDGTTGIEERAPCSAVVVAAGAISTAQILLQSQSAEFPDGLGNAHDVLGRYLHDHPVGKLVLDLASGLSVLPPAYVTRLPLESAPPLRAAACLQWTGAAVMARSLLNGHPGRPRWAGFNVFGTMTPSKENRVSLDASQVGPNGSTGLKLHIRCPEDSLAVLDETRDALIALLAKGNFEPKIRVWKVEPVGHSIHYGGTCRMHSSPEFGMLNGWNRLHAVPNVVVADSAAFTTGPEKNPVLTAMALAARAGDRLARDLRSGVV